MTKNKNSVQGLIGFERFTRFGVKTDKAEIAFYFCFVSGKYRRKNSPLDDAVKHDTGP